ncbi:HlyD family type I secretion periplasmic adaptor subunit [Enterobacteriaceae bacterium 4M9]|nr:HlyD family type I secretion periplasmic adaptor subunit [Enterobacteriaceae bacterium 4M9]
MLTPQESSVQNLPGLRREDRYIRLGWVVIAVGLLSFLLWAGLAPLDKGVPAQGTVIVSGKRKQVQAPTGGVVAEILVREGDRVQAGEPLLRMNSVAAKAKYERLRTSYINALASEARLAAERDGAATIAFPEELASKAFLQEAPQSMALQRELFAARAQALHNQVAANEQTIAGIALQLQGLTTSLVQKQHVSASLRSQVASMRPLVQEGFLPRNRFLEIERQLNDVQSQIAEMNGEIGRAQKQQLELRERIKQLKTDYQQEVKSQLAQTQNELSNYRSELHTAEFELQHTTLFAPAQGRVMSLAVFNPGSVVSPGELLMEVVPINAPLVVEARLPSHLIDKVHTGLPVNMMFTAFNQNKTPTIAGEVTLVAADLMTDKASGQSWYQVQISVTDEGHAQLADNIIRPGMPVEVLIRTGSRTLLNYLFKPVLDRTATAFTEE